MSASATVKRTAKRSRAGVVLGRIAVERWRDTRRLLGRRDGPMGATHKRFDLAGSVAYVNAVFDDYIRYGDLPRESLAGRRVLELGPGDNLGVAMLFVAAGASRVVAADRFIPYRDPGAEMRVIRELAAGLPPEGRERIEPALGGDRLDLSRIPLEFHQELPIERAPQALGAGEFDLIVSRAVLEHVADLPAAFEAMDALLEPGGTMIHKVDLEDHSLFTGGGQNPLTFLTIPDRMYRWMGEDSAGLPNRVLMGWYQEELERRGYEATFRITHVVGQEGEIEPHPPVEDGLPAQARLELVDEVEPRLLPRYRGLPREELAVAGFMVTARKPT